MDAAWIARRKAVKGVLTALGRFKKYRSHAEGRWNNGV
jgi:hypothetical protein